MLASNLREQLCRQSKLEDQHFNFVYFVCYFVHQSLLISFKCQIFFSSPWALTTLNLAANLDVDSIFIESDSKSCIDVLRFPNWDVPWRIKTICSDVLALKLNFSNCRFNWVAREANVAAHVLAKWSLSNNYFGSFDVGLGPPCFVSIIRAEALSLLV